MNGKSVEVDNTDAEGRLVLAGAHSCYPLTSWSVLTFSKMRSIMHQPNSSHTVIDVATLTGYVLIVHTSRLEFMINRAMDIA